LALADALKASFYDGDTFHPEANIAKMSAGIPLTDEDREPWLRAINEWIKITLPSEKLIVACSALKERYRKIIVADIDPSLVIWVHLQGSYELIFKRMNEREGHYMSASMLRSQVDAYEAPDYGIIANVDQDVKQTVQRIMAEIGEQE
jgi:carbohydrate kinase (thermoresistant glucokinase family)